MRADALQPLKATLEDDDAAPEKTELRKTPYSEEELQEARQFLRLSRPASRLLLQRQRHQRLRLVMV